MGSSEDGLMPTNSNNDNQYSTVNGCPVMSPYSATMVGTPGPLVLGDPHTLDIISHFDRERIPERVVHANGGGAFGEFEVLDDVTHLTSAKFLNKVGKKTKLVNRFSTVAGESGSADATRDVRGFSVKLYTEEGNLDWVYINTPVFFIRDPTKFPILNHTQKRNPQTHLKDPTMFWDFLVQNPESLQQVMILFSDRGTPHDWRHMHGYSAHTYKWVKEDGSFNFVQIHLKSDQGIKNFNNEESIEMSGKNPDNAIQDLYEAIDRKEYPSWTAYYQVMSPEEAKKQDFSVYDMTKIWPQKEFPLHRFGRFTLNKNPDNYFAEIEQLAFSPSNSVPGWEPSYDPVLQLRLYAYNDTQRYRLGANFDQIPVNRCPIAHNPFLRDGAMNVSGNYGSQPNYPSSYQPISYPKQNNINPKSLEAEVWNATAAKFEWKVTGPQDYAQCTLLWEVYGKTGQQEAMIHNIAVHSAGARKETQEQVCELLSKAHPEIGKRVREAQQQVNSEI